jgi:hypothetical protein
VVGVWVGCVGVCGGWLCGWCGCVWCVYVCGVGMCVCHIFICWNFTKPRMNVTAVHCGNNNMAVRRICEVKGT